MSYDERARDVAEYGKALRMIARMPDAESWLDIARIMADLVVHEGLTADEAKAQAIDAYDQAHGIGKHYRGAS